MRATPRIATALLLGLAACGPSASGTGGDGDGDGDGDLDADLDAGICEDVIDVVFVLDTSSSMSFVLQDLEAEIAEVVTASNQLAADSHFGLVVFQDNHAIDDQGPLGNGMVHTEAATLQQRFRHYRETYTDFDRNPGDGPGGPIQQNPICEENSLDALYAAATEFPWRENATRVIILATDDTFLENPDNYGDRDGDGDTTDTSFPSEGDYPALRTMAETLDALRDARIRVFSFARVTPPGLFEGGCGTGRRRPAGDISAGWNKAYDGQAPIPEQTDAVNFDLAQVQSGALSLAATINEVVLESFCTPPVL